MGGDAVDPPPAADGQLLEELLDVLRLSDLRASYERDIERRQEAGHPIAILVKALSELPNVTGLDALRTSRQVVDLLTGARWHMIRQAREEGSSWSQIGGALGVSKQAAFDFYQRKLDLQDASSMDADSSVRSRAAQGENSSN